MILFAESFVQNSVVEFFHKKIHVLIKAKRITKEEEEIEAYDVDADIKFPEFKTAHIKAAKLSFDPQKFECHALDDIKLVWDDVTVKSTNLIFKIKEYTAFSKVTQKGYYKAWTFVVPELLYEHAKRMLTFSKGCEIFDKEFELIADRGELQLDKWFQLSKNVTLKGDGFEVMSKYLKCYLGKNQQIEKVESPHKTIFKADGGVVASGEQLVYEKGEVIVRKNVLCTIYSKESASTDVGV